MAERRCEEGGRAKRGDKAAGTVRHRLCDCATLPAVLLPLSGHRPALARRRLPFRRAHAVREGRTAHAPAHAHVHVLARASRYRRHYLHPPATDRPTLRQADQLQRKLEAERLQRQQELVLERRRAVADAKAAAEKAKKAREAAYDPAGAEGGADELDMYLRAAERVAGVGEYSTVR